MRDLEKRFGAYLEESGERITQEMEVSTEDSLSRTLEDMNSYRSFAPGNTRLQSSIDKFLDEQGESAQRHFARNLEIGQRSIERISSRRSR